MRISDWSSDVCSSDLAEFRSVQAHYPIVFRATGDDGFQPIALFGLREGENLFLDGDRWDATCLPLAVERQPFLIGTADDGGLLMHVDLDSPRVGTADGQALFREHGGTTDFLDRMNSVLLALYEGLQGRSEEHTSELQSLMTISYAVFCLKN